MALPAGLSPATTTFEASHSDNLSYWSVEIGGPPRICTVFSPVKSRDFTVKVCSPFIAVRKDRDTKAELNRRSQVCEILAGTGIRVA